MKLKLALCLGLFVMSETAFAGSIDLNCSSPNQDIFVSRDEVKIKGQSYRHLGTNDVINLDSPGEAVDLALLTQTLKPTNIKIDLLAQSELATKADTTGCRDIFDTWTLVHYKLKNGPKDLETSGLLICRCRETA